MNYTFVLCALCLMISCSSPDHHSLDGQTYLVQTWDVNHPEKKEPDTLIFKDGMVDSKSCHQWGFMAAPYSAQKQMSSIRFAFKMESAAEGVMQFNGTTSENSIKGSLVWKKQNQKDISYEFTGHKE